MGSTESNLSGEGPYASFELTQAALDALPSQICVLDDSGQILATNDAWRRFERENQPPGKEVRNPTKNYLEVCSRAAGEGVPQGAEFAQGIREVLEGAREEFSLEYPCHSPSEQRWFVARVRRFTLGGLRRLVISHENITSRKLIEEASRRLAAIVESSADGIVSKDLNGIVTSWNQGAGIIFGYTAEEMIGQPILRLIPTERQGEETLILSKIRNGETLRHFETVRKKKDGTFIHVSVTVSPIRDSEGQVTGASKVARDITDRKRAEEALRKSELEQRNLATQLEIERARLVEAQLVAKVGSWETDLTTMNVVWSAATFRIFETSPDFQPTHPKFLTLVHPEDRAKVEEAFLKSLDQPGPFSCEHRLLLNGRVKVIEERWRIFHDGAGHPIRALGTCQDITERKKSESRLRRLVDSNAQGVVFWRNESEVTGANDAFLKIVGYTRADLEAGLVSWELLTPKESLELDRLAMNDIRVKGSCIPYEKEYVRKDGTRVPVLVGATVFEDSPNEGVCFVIDLTDRKKLEQQFLRAQRMESIGTLAGGIAHDLNNVLAPILMSVEMLRMMVPEGEAASLLDSLKQSTQRGAALVKQVLSFARGVEGQQVKLDPQQILRDLLKFMQETFPKSVDVRFESSRTLWSITGDPTQIHQVVLNLCVNAKDAMPEGGMLTIRAANVVLDETYAAMNLDARPGSYVVLNVEDTGTGIPRELLDRIFEPFFTTKEVGKGTGLGLSTTLAIVKSHLGFINVYSELGKGTKFKVYFPANTNQAAADTVAVEQSRQPRGNGELVLVVDDEESIRVVAQKTLERFGYRVVLACHGAEAIAIYAGRRDEIDVVLTDMAMPIMDGPALIVALKTLNPLVRIIGSSGLSSNGGVAKAVGAGVEHFVPKPYTADTLLKTLHQILGKKPQSPV